MLLFEYEIAKYHFVKAFGVSWKKIMRFVAFRLPLCNILFTQIYHIWSDGSSKERWFFLQATWHDWRDKQKIYELIHENPLK